MLSDISKKLDQIKDEVNDFHPLLNTLLPKLIGIRKVEYKHGPNEKGTDFILTKHDDTLEKTVYIGVIAKIDKITQSSIFDVGRQIEECDLARYIENGKKSIFLDEIWVICNGKISINAQEKIHDKYRSKKIEFIDKEKLSDLIKKFLPDYLYDMPVKIGEYLAQKKAKNEEIDKRFNLINLEDSQLYIEQDIIEIEEGEYNINNKRRNKRKINKIDIHDKIENEKFIIIEADMGAGKSKLVRKLVDYYTTPEIYLKSKIIPISINYRDFCEKYRFDINDTICSQINNLSLSDFDKDSLFLLLIDGFDEKKDTLENQLSNLDKLSEDASNKNNVRVVLTSRYINALYDKKIKLKKRALRLEIAPLSQRKMLEFLKDLCAEINISKRIADDLKRSPLIRDLTRKPIAAILLAKLLNENSEELPSNITELYSKYLELMLGRWDIMKGLETQKEYDASESVMMEIANYLIDNNIEYLSKDECNYFFSQYLSKRNMDINPKELCEKIIFRSGIISEDKNTGNIYFSHRTFTEFFYSKLKHRDKSLPIDNRVFQLYWMNIYFFYVGLHKDCPELLNQIVALETTSEGERWLKLINMSNYFLAGYATPYEIIENNLHKTLIDASKLFLDILDKRIRSPFSILSEISLLWWTQYIVRDSYGYDFFKKAIDNVILNIDDSAEADIVKVYALFFTGVISIDLNNDEPFNFLIDKYSTKMPLNIKLAINHEGENLENQSIVLKKQIKKIRRLMRTLDRKEIESLYRQPISLKTIK